MFKPVWKVYNELVDFIAELRPMDGRLIKVKRSPNGWYPTVEIPKQEQQPGISQYILKEMFGDYVVCHTYEGGVEGSEDIAIAKPFRLRRTPFDGNSIAFSSDGDTYTASYAYVSNTNRNVSISGSTESQIVVPRYKEDFDLIYAMECDGLDLLDAESNAIALIDINADGRAWAKV